MTHQRPPAILIVGDTMVDRYIIGEASRLSPEAPVPVMRAAREESRPGGAANVAANVAALGQRCVLLTVSGDDAAGDDLARMMKERKVALDRVIDPGRPTTQKTRVVSGVQQIARIDHDGHASETAQAELVRRFEAQIDGVRAVIFSDYDMGVLHQLPLLLSIARKYGVPAFVDPKCADRSRYKGAFLLKPNAREFHALFGACDEAHIAAHAASVLEAMALRYLVVTRGDKGMLMVSRDGTMVDHPTEALQVFDVTGAGDTTMAALVVGIVEGLPIAAAIDQANVAASIAVSRQGTYAVTRGDLEERLYRRDHAMTKMIPLPLLLAKLDHVRANGARIVFTNGCFDVLHAGHVRLLDLARRQGDVLIVGLNDDASIRRLKGPSRPVSSLADRAEVLSGLAAVDHIVSFSDDTPIDLIRTIRPDVLVKGGDYTPETMVGADVVRASGGTIFFAPLLAGRSTTALLRAGNVLEHVGD